MRSTNWVVTLGSCHRYSWKWDCPVFSRSIPVPPPEKARVVKPQVRGASVDIHFVVMACIEKTAPQRLQLKDEAWECSDEKHRYVPCGGPEEAGVTYLCSQNYQPLGERASVGFDASYC